MKLSIKIKNGFPQWRFVNLTLEGVHNRQLVIMAVNCNYCIFAMWNNSNRHKIKQIGAEFTGNIYDSDNQLKYII